MKWFWHVHRWHKVRDDSHFIYQECRSCGTRRVKLTYSMSHDNDYWADEDWLKGDSKNPVTMWNIGQGRDNPRWVTWD